MGGCCGGEDNAGNMNTKKGAKQTASRPKPAPAAAGTAGQRK